MPQDTEVCIADVASKFRAPANLGMVPGFASVKGRGWICQKIACSRSGTTYQSAGLLISFLDLAPTSWLVVALPFKMTVGSTAMLRSVRAAFLRRTCLSRLER